MWVISGPFDGQERNEVGFKSKRSVHPCVVVDIDNFRGETAQDGLAILFRKKGTPAYREPRQGVSRSLCFHRGPIFARRYCEFSIPSIHEFIIIPFDVIKIDPSVVPLLSLHNTGKKPMTITRGGDSLTLNPSSTEELRNEDIINIIVGVSLG